MSEIDRANAQTGEPDVLQNDSNRESTKITIGCMHTLRGMYGETEFSLKHRMQPEFTMKETFRGKSKSTIASGVINLVEIDTGTKLGDSVEEENKRKNNLEDTTTNRNFGFFLHVACPTVKIRPLDHLQSIRSVKNDQKHVSKVKFDYVDFAP